MSKGDATVILKRELRKHMRQVLRNMQPEQLAEESANLTKRLVSSAFYRNARAIAVYASMQNEFNTRPIIIDAFASRKRVFLPRVLSNATRSMTMLEVRSMDELNGWEPNSWGIREPPLEVDRADSPRDHPLDLIIVPGVAFDMSGGRCGYGMGFYDTFLARYKARRGNLPRLIAPAFHAQIIDSVPVTPEDWPVDEVMVVD
jgi:5-formyltetrahydrofolate cyclo-ligase